MCFFFWQLRGNTEQAAARSMLANGFYSAPSSSSRSPPPPPPPRSQTGVNGCSQEQMSDAFCCGRRAQRRRGGWGGGGSGKIRAGVDAHEEPRPPTSNTERSSAPRFRKKTIRDSEVLLQSETTQHSLTRQNKKRTPKLRERVQFQAILRLSYIIPTLDLET